MRSSCAARTNFRDASMASGDTLGRQDLPPPLRMDPGHGPSRVKARPERLVLVHGLDNTTHLLPAQPERDARPDRRVVGDGHGEDVDRRRGARAAERDAAALRRHERVVDVLGAGRAAAPTA